MKREVHIHIFIDDESEPSSSHVRRGPSIDQVTKNPDAKPDEVQDYYMEIFRDDISPDHKLTDIMAHELGHVVQQVFETKAFLEDARHAIPEGVNFLEHIGAPLPKAWLQTMHKEEAEAWKIANQMVPIDKKLAEKDLDTYKD